MSSSRFTSGVQWTGLQLAVTLLFSLAKMYVLTRYLSPTDFGLIALITFLLSIAELIAGFGLHAAILHIPVLSASQRSTIFWINIALALSIYLILQFISPLFAIFYNTKELHPLLSITGIILLISALGRLQLSIEYKSMNFKRTGLIAMLSELASGVFTIVFAVKGLGIWSVLYGMLADAVFKNSLYFISCVFINRSVQFRFSFTEARYFLKIGGYYMFAKVVGQLSINLDLLLVERIFGLEALGKYSLAKQLAQKPLRFSGPIIQKVFAPYLAFVRHHSDNIKEKYLSLVNINSFFNIITTLVFLYFTEIIVQYLYGADYSGIVPLTRLLGIFLLLRTINSPVMALSTARGLTQYDFQWNLLQLFIIPVFLFAGSWAGLEGIAIAFILMRLALYFPSWYFFGRRLVGASFNEQLQANFLFRRTDLKKYAEILFKMLPRFKKRSMYP